VVCEASVRCSVHGARLAVDSLAGQGEILARRFRASGQFNAAIFVRFDREDEGVDFVAEFGGKSGFEE